MQEENLELDHLYQDLNRAMLDRVDRVLLAAYGKWRETPHRTRVKRRT